MRHLAGYIQPVAEVVQQRRDRLALRVIQVVRPRRVARIGTAQGRPQGIAAETGGQDLGCGPGRVRDEPDRSAPGRFPRFVVTLDLVQALNGEVRWLVVDLLVMLSAEQDQVVVAVRVLDLPGSRAAR